MQGFRLIFATVPDPRDINAQHDLTEILFIALAASLCGANSCTAFAAFGCAKEELLRQFLTLDHGIPSHDTFSRVFRHLDPEALEAALVRFTAALGAELGQDVAGQVVAVDGKRLRRAYDTGRAHMAPLMVSAYLNHTRLVLAQTLAPGTGEIKGVLKLFELIALEGAIVTGDALHCTRQTAATLVAKGADYVLTLKGNRSSLAKEAQVRFARLASRAPSAETRERAHGRTERRRAQVITALDLETRFGFTGLAALGRIEAWRTVGSKTSHKVRYFVLSRPMTPQQLLATVREHWSIENRVHWPLDVVFDEDLSRTRTDHGPRNLAVLRSLTLNMLRANPSKGSLNIKRQRAGWDDRFFIELMTHVR